jgi:hypothetical protein
MHLPRICAATFYNNSLVAGFHGKTGKYPAPQSYVYGIRRRVRTVFA